jgi:hypothetical protein
MTYTEKERLRQWLLDHGQVLTEEHLATMPPLPEDPVAVYAMAYDGAYHFGYIARKCVDTFLAKHSEGWTIPDLPRHWWVRTVEEVRIMERRNDVRLICDQHRAGKL